MPRKKINISFYTLGCRLNQNETELLEQLFDSEKSYQIVKPNYPSHIAVINTCTVTDKSDSDTRKLVNKLVRINPEIKIALIGCQSQTQKDDLSHLPNVRWIIGNERKFHLLSILEKETKNNDPKIITPTISSKNFSLPISTSMHHHTRAHLKIQDGCDCFCSYCEVPYARGHARSRVFSNILEEAKILAQTGHKEIVLTGINLGLYHYKSYKLLDVIEALEQIPSLKRIRISSIEFTTVADSLLKKMSQQSKLCRFLHVPLQSGSDEILKSMNRKYRFKEFYDFIKKANLTIPDVCLGTDIIVGFPGETEKHFLETYSHLKNLPINYFHVFSYSQRRFAKSRFLKNTVDKNEKSARSQILRQLSIAKHDSFLRSLLHRTQHVLFEEKKEALWFGFSDNYVRIAVYSNKFLKNKLLPVVLEKIDNGIMIGKIIL